MQRALKQLVCVVMAGSAAAGVAQAGAIAADTFAAGDTYQHSIYYALLPSASGSFGFVFESAATGNIEEIVLAIRGSGNFRAELFEVGSDLLPTTSLGSWSAAATGGIDSSYGALPHIYPLDGPRLHAGESYALVVHSEATSTLPWFYGRPIGTNKLPLVEFDSGGNWMVNTLDASAFRVFVPAPASMFSLAVVGAAARRRR